MKMPESTVILSGDVFQVTPVTDYETKAPNGCKVAILGGGGATEVKLRQELMHVAPIVGDSVAWHVRPFPYDMNGISGVSFQFVGIADLGSVDHLHNIVSNLSPVTASK